MVINWEILDTEREVSTGKVITVSYLAFANLDNYKAQVFGILETEEPKDIEKIIKFEDLTKEIIIGWVIDKLGSEKVQEIETGIINNLKAQKDLDEAKTKVNGLPW